MNLDHPRYPYFAAMANAEAEAAHQACTAAQAILNAPIPANHALKVFLTGKAQVFERALQTVRNVMNWSGPLPAELVWIADRAARAAWKLD